MPKELSKAVVMDVLSSLGVPTSTAEQLFRKYWARKASEVRETLLEEIAQGADPLITASDDDGVEIVIRVMNAAIAGAARINLRLMAKVLAGLARHPPIYASDFARYQRAIADLSREEINFVATLYRHWKTSRSTSENEPAAASEAWKQTTKELVPGLFPTENHMRTAAYAVQRFGLVIAGNRWDESGILKPSPLMDEIARLASFEEALKREPEPRR